MACPNRSCGKVFAKPLKALNLQANSAGPYDACPYCLTEITRLEGSIDLPVEIAVEAPQTGVEEQVAEVASEETVATQQSSSCGFHLGYLSERDKKSQIPDECMTCKDMIECMLRKMRE
jgi:hypothetical protein